MLPALVGLALLFGLLFLTRIGGAYRTILMRRWPALVLAGAAILALARGALWPALALASLAVTVWVLWPGIERAMHAKPPQPRSETPEDFAARTLLGVGPTASAAEIRAAYRAKMAQAHPDRGGSHNEAARLTAARDRLLKRSR